MDDKYRMDSTTDVEDDGSDYAKVEVQGSLLENWRSSPVEEPIRLRFSSSRASHTDNPYRKTPSRLSRPAADRPLSQLEFRDYPTNRPWRCGDPYRYAAPKEGKDAWQKCRKLADKYDDEMCAAWKEEIDKLLIFAGLFSATVTAFTVESYKWLQKESDDQTLQLIAYLTAHLTQDAGPLPHSVAVQPFSVSNTEVRINAVWFLSLTLSLTTVLVGILCLQWLREYQRDGTLPHKDAIALRQMRFDGLMFWRVPEIMTLLPLLLQISLVLFFLGLLDLLWARNVAVAASVTVAVGIVLLFIAITTVLPTLQHAITPNEHLRIVQCPYKSPQSWLFYRLSHALFFLFTKLISSLVSSTPDSPRFHRLLKSTTDTSWLAFDMRWRRLRDASTVVRGAPKDAKDGEDLFDALHWLNTTFTQNITAVYPLHTCLSGAPRALDVGAAEEVISRMYADLDLHMDAATFRVMLDDRYSPADAQKRDIVKAFYLHLHKDLHRAALWGEYVEVVLRILNTQDVPRPFYDWLSEILIELSGKVVVISGTGTTTRGKRNRKSAGWGDDTKRLQLVDDDEEVLLVQVLMCVRGLIISDALRLLDMAMAWNLMYYLLHGFSPQPLAGPRTPGDLDAKDGERLALVLSIVDALLAWLKKGKAMDRLEKVRLCAEGVLKIFPHEVLAASADALPRAPSSEGYVPLEPAENDDGGDDDGDDDDDDDEGDGVSAGRLDARDIGGREQRGMASVFALIQSLDDHMARMGGARAVLDREKQWHEFWESKFSGDDWTFLLSAVSAFPL